MARLTETTTRITSAACTGSAAKPAVVYTLADRYYTKCACSVCGGVFVTRSDGMTPVHKRRPL